MLTPNNSLRWAIVGLGKQAERLADALQKTNKQSLNVAISNNEERAKVFAAKYCVPHAFGSLSKFLREDAHEKLIEVVCITSPNTRHTKEVIKVARAGKHVLCEKPLALSVAGAQLMVKVMQKNHVHGFVNFHLRMDSEVQKAKTILAKGELGEIVYIEMQWSIGTPGKSLPSLPAHMQWREDPALSGGGALMARGVHLFDLLRFITGREVIEVRGWSDATTRSVDRTASGILILEKNIPVSILTSKVMADANNHIAIYGTQGRLVLENLFRADPGLLYEKTFNSFALALKGHDTKLATFEDGLAVTAITKAFQKSCQLRRNVRVSTV